MGANQLRPWTQGLSPHTMRALLLLLYGAGLRLGEALKLEQADVNVKARLLHVRQSKFFKTGWCRLGRNWPRCWKIMRPSVLLAMVPTNAFRAPTKARP